jgi:stage V sporulation protein SpoVS
VLTAGVVTLGLAAAPPAPGTAGVAGYQVVALMPLSSLGSTEEAAQAVERVLVTELGKVLGKRLIPPNELAVRAKSAAKAITSCEGVVTCLLEVVGALGWDAFVVGNIAGLGDDRVINLKLIDVRGGGEVRRMSVKASGDESGLVRQMRVAAITLLAPEQLVGVLDLRCDQKGVLIALDGAAIGTTPLAQTKRAVPVGRHAIEATGDGLVSFTTLVDVEYESDIRVDISLPVNSVFVGGDTPFRGRWWTWAIGGAGLLSVGLGGYFNYLQAQAAERIEREAAAGTLRGERGKQLWAENDDNWDRAVAFYAAGGALVLTVAVLFGVDLVTGE